MAVESFIQPSESKLTVEKQVKEKPSVEELTTIETPGRPTPASMLESSDEKPRKTRKKSSKPKASMLETEEVARKRDAILIITEKPQAAMKIASALGNAKKYNEDGVPYYELTRDGKRILVASAVGHLFGLTYKKGQKGWPIFELEWIPSYNNKSAAFTRKYYNVLRKLSLQAKEYIVATDFDIEGEVIGWNVLRFICKKDNAKRMKYSTLTAPELVKSYESPMPELAWGNAYAGESRHILDWLYGINLSRALMSAIKTSGSFRILSIGRVQGPALKIIVDREREISSFKPVPFWNVFALANNLRFKHPEDIFDNKELEKFKKIKSAEAETKKTETSEHPPFPFDLTTLQRESYRWLKLSPSQTLSIAQKLYLDGLISYPRTSSQKIPKEIEPKKILKSLSNQFKEISLATRDKPIEGPKSDPAHPSIYPTGEYADLTGQEEKLYNLIVKRFISCFSPDLKTANKRIILTATDSKGLPLTYEIKENNNSDDDEGNPSQNSNSKKTKISPITFTLSGYTIIEKGWASIYPADLEELNLPDIKGKVKIDKIEIEEKETQPPKRYTPASLVSLLEKKNLGTKATRSMIVDTLFDRGYLDGKSIQATALGMKLIEALEKYSSIIIDENLTRKLEDEMEKIQDSNSNLKAQEEKVIEEAKNIITDISKEFKAQETNIGKILSDGLQEVRKEQQINNTLQQCPTCKKGNLRIMFNRNARRYFISCSAYPECRQTYSLPPNALIKKADKTCPADGFPKLLAIRKAKRPWEFCFNPECPIEKQKKEEWAEKKGLTKKDEEEPEDSESKESSKEETD